MKTDESYIEKDKIATLQKQIQQQKVEIQDITLLKDKAMNIIQNSPMIFWTLDKEGIFTLSEGGSLKQLGLKPGQVVGMSVFDVYKDFPNIIESQRRTLDGENTQYLFELQGSQYAGDEVKVEKTYFESKNVPLFDANNQVIGLLGVAYDITPLKKIEVQLAESKQRYSTLVYEAPLAIIVLKDGYVKFANPASLKLFEYDFEKEILDIMSAKLLASSVREKLLKRTKDREAGLDVVSDYETIGLKRNGIEFPMFVYARTITFNNQRAVMTFFIDLTETKNLEKEREEIHQQLLKSQKLESLGVLAGGIAHDFNNILVGIIGNASLAEARLEKGSDALYLIKEIQDISEKAADLTKQMLAYTGKTKIDWKVSNLNVIIKEMNHLLNVSISKSIQLKYDMDDEIGLFEADVTQIRQIILNVVINSSEAIGEKNGVISIITRNQKIDSNYTVDFSFSTDLKEGDYIYLEISDNGSGIPKHIINQIFDPFFSTKFTGRGLGLSVVQGIIKGHGGAIKVYSEMDKGTSFKFLFPRSEKNQVDKIEDSTEIADSEIIGSVLFCDDDPTITKTAENMLRYLGYEVIIASNGKEGIELLEENIDKIKLIILDLTMPIMSGKETFSKMRKISQNIPIILSSGYNEVEIVERFVGRNLTGFLQKPYSIDKLRQTINKAFNQ
ncbi:MAG: Blue-light-activated protein [Candidatus Heimdallarchaeota archaeon LC_2]|nr:MAG: Blue-light-activated protein [Candidatus Heimdallarchaeota archaeon LC_2]